MYSLGEIQNLKGCYVLKFICTYPFWTQSTISFEDDVISLNYTSAV